MLTPVPVQQQAIPKSAFPDTTASPTARPTEGQSSGVPGASAPAGITS
jgi:hypothetical protein